MKKGAIAFIGILLLIIFIPSIVSADKLVVYAISTNSDGKIYYDGTKTTFALLRAASGSGITNTSNNASQPTYVTYGENSYGQLGGFGWVGNTSEIPDDATINSAIFSVYADGQNVQNYAGMNLTVTSFNPANPLILSKSDFQTRNWLVYSNNISISSWQTEARNNFTLSNLSVISKTGLTPLFVTTKWDIDNSGPTAVAGTKIVKTGIYDTTKGTTFRPFLEIDFTPAAEEDTTPPASITDLANETTCNSINWTWTNPADADFNHTMIYSEAGFLYNKSNTTAFDLWSGIAESTSYTISTKTCDITGNCNQSWVNQTAITGTCGVAPVTNFTADYTNVCDGSEVQFTDTTENDPTDWDWYFWANETKSSDEQNPAQVFSTPGIYTIRLYTSNIYGGDWENKTGYITVYDCTPPASITNLAYNNDTCQVTNWSWTNPADADYAYLYTMKNNEFHSNVTSPTEFLAWMSITAGEFSSRTVDNEGNMNETWVNMTAPDAAVCDVDPPLAPINLANTTTCNSINWSWEAADEDYYQVLVYRYDEGDPLGDYFYHFVTEPTFYDLWTGLEEDTEYTISLKSSDGGNVNDTWVNQTAITGFCGIAPVAAFSANDTEVCTGIPIAFTDLSANIPTSWNWSFGDGNFSDEQNPVKQYAYAGTFTVILDAGNSYGNDTESKAGYITVNDCSPTADFTYNATCGVGNLSVQFTDTSTGTPTDWYWIFGEGNTSVEQNPVFTYTVPGVYTVNFSSSNIYGMDWQNKSNILTVAMPGTFCSGGNGTGEPTYTTISNSNEDMFWTAGMLGAIGLVIVGVTIRRKKSNGDEDDDDDS